MVSISNNQANPQGGFPNFPDGDVVITLSLTRTYRLHASVLRRASPVFRDLLVEASIETDTPRKRKRAKRATQYRVKYEQDAETEEGCFILDVSSPRPSCHLRTSLTPHAAGNRQHVT